MGGPLLSYAGGLLTAVVLLVQGQEATFVHSLTRVMLLQRRDALLTRSSAHAILVLRRLRRAGQARGRRGAHVRAEVPRGSPRTAARAAQICGRRAVVRCARLVPGGCMLMTCSCAGYGKAQIRWAC